MPGKEAEAATRQLKELNEQLSFSVKMAEQRAMMSAGNVKSVQVRHMHSLPVLWLPTLAPGHFNLGML